VQRLEAILSPEARERMHSLSELETAVSASNAMCIVISAMEHEDWTDEIVAGICAIGNQVAGNLTRCLGECYRYTWCLERQLLAAYKTRPPQQSRGGEVAK